MRTNARFVTSRVKRVQVEGRERLQDHAAVAHLAPAVREMEAELGRLAGRLDGRTVWMVNSTDRGGGVAEMLPGIVTLLVDLGIAVEWVVIEAEETRFFDLTKRIHNLIHGVGDPRLGPADRDLFERTNLTNAEALRPLLREGDILVVHDPQPMPLASYLADTGVLPIWRCHIGLDEENAATTAAWEFLRPYAAPYRHAVFSAPEYIPPFFGARATVIYPAIDPLRPKNRDLHLHRLVEVLSNSALAVVPGPVVNPPYRHLAQRLQPTDGLAPADKPEDIGLLNRPIITQISRWDRLKGFHPLMLAFAELKSRYRHESERARLQPLHRRRIDLARLVLAGPDPYAIRDDPEAIEVLEQLRLEYVRLPGSVRDDIAILLLPMQEPDENAWMVNALQRTATIVAQNSIREGFGLTVSEAMWKRLPVLTNHRACGPRQQVRDGLDGLLVRDPENVPELAQAMVAMLEDTDRLDVWGRNAQRRAHDHFMIYAQLCAWGRLIGKLIGP